MPMILRAFFFIEYTPYKFVIRLVAFCASTLNLPRLPSNRNSRRVEYSVPARHLLLDFQEFPLLI
ncbi:MAG: hypothetical protein ACKPKO_48055, partial [Candidatus Fonsibacter sp.]